MARKRRTYTPEFKAEAVKLVTDQGYSVAEAARSLGIGETLLRSWKQALDTQGDQAFPGHGKLPPFEEEVRRLRAENQRLRAERDILKKLRRSSPKADLTCSPNRLGLSAANGEPGGTNPPPAGGVFSQATNDGPGG